MMRWHLICACSRFSPPFTYSLMGSLNGQGYNNDNDNNNRLTISLFRYMVSCSGSWRRFNGGQNRGRRRSSCSPHPFRSPAIVSATGRIRTDHPLFRLRRLLSDRRATAEKPIGSAWNQHTHTHTMLVIYHADEPKTRGRKRGFRAEDRAFSYRWLMSPRAWQAV